MDQTLESQWGREPLIVAAEIPTVMLRHRLGRVHVGTPDSEVEELVRKAIAEAPHPFSEQQSDETVAAALWLHHENRSVYAHVMSGRL